MTKILLIALLGFAVQCSAQINNKLRNELIEIYKSDQDRPLSLSGKDFLNRWKKQNITDSLNLIRVSNILDSIGFPGKSMVGDSAYLATFLVIQHSDLKNQERYLPVFQKAAGENEIEWKFVVLMIDRVKVNKNEKQIYGTQAHGAVDPKTGYITGEAEFYPIEDEAHVNIRRQKVGLSPIEEYAKQIGIKYKIQK